MIKNNLDLECKTIEQWTVLKELGNGKIKVRCSCGTEKIIYKKSLIEGKTKSCGCLKSKYVSENQLINLDGKTFGEWTVIKDTKPKYVLCRCSCGIEREVQKQALKDGRSKSCGHKFFTEDVTGKTFGEWYVLKDNKNDYVMVQCSCGVIKINRKHSIVHGISKSCGHSEPMKGMKFGDWEVIEDIKNSRKKLCKCSCSTIREIHPTLLRNGYTKSCGCKIGEHSKLTMLERYGDISSSRIYNPRCTWQIDIINDRNKMLKYIDNLGYKPTIYELHKMLDLSTSRTVNVIHNLKLDNYIDWHSKSSGPEADIADYIRDVLGYDIVTSDRDIIAPYELDIYIPEIKTAIEFNGNYWHSTTYKDTEYHQRKSLDALSKGVRLIHVYEYEWNNNKEYVLSELTKSLYDTDITDVKDGLDIIKLSLDKDDILYYLNKGYNVLSIEKPVSIVVDTYEIYNSGNILLKKERKVN